MPYYGVCRTEFNYFSFKLTTMQILRQQIEAIIPLTDEEFTYIASHFTVKRLRKHAFLVQQGNIVTHEFFVVKGCLKAYYFDEAKAREHIYQFALEDWWITDREAFLKQEAATVNIDCIEDCEVLCLSFADREKLCSEMHKMEHYFRVKSNWGYISLQKRIILMLKDNAKERYEYFVKQYPQLTQRIPKTLIASYLGITRETLSRLYNQ